MVALFLSDGGEAGCKEVRFIFCYYMKSETHKGWKCVTLICLLCPMLVIIHFWKYHIWKEKKKMADRLIPRRTISCWKASLPPQKENWTFFWTFSFHFWSFNSIFLTLKCRTLVLKNHRMVIVWQPFCWKWISFTKVSKHGKSEYSRALNASYMFQPLVSFWCYTTTWEISAIWLA